MRILILVAHGSRRADSNDEVRVVAAALEARLAGCYRHVRPAFLELAEPSIPAAIDAALAAGAEVVEVFPYFLSAGRHVERDIPALVTAKRAEHPNARIELRPYLGRLPGLVDLMADQLAVPESKAP